VNCAGTRGVQVVTPLFALKLHFANRSNSGKNATDDRLAKKSGKKERKEYSVVQIKTVNDGDVLQRERTAITHVSSSTGCFQL